MKPAIFDPEAEAEFRADIPYYEGKREGLGVEFREAVEGAVEQIRKMPLAFSLYGETGVRKYVMRRFPYNIFYVELEDCIWIAAVAHQRRRPGYWAGRSP